MGHIDFECVELGRARAPLRFHRFAPPCLRPLRPLRPHSGESRGSWDGRVNLIAAFSPPMRGLIVA